MNVAQKRSQSPRIVWMDIFRGFAMLLIIFLHTVNAAKTNIAGVHPLFNDINLFFRPFRMAGLFLLSGFFVERSLRKGLSQYLLGKIRHIAWPYGVWVVLTELARDGYFSQSDFFRAFTPNEPNLWFLWYLLFFYIIHLLFQKQHPILLATISMGLSLFTPNDWSISRLTYMYAFFCIGIFFSRYLKQFDSIFRKPAALAATFLPAIFIALKSVIDGGIRYEALYAPWVLVGVLFLISCCTHLEKVKFIASPLAFIGKYSIIFFLLNKPLVLLLSRLEIMQTIHRSIFVVPLIFISVLLIASFTVRITRSIPLTRIFFEFPRAKIVKKKGIDEKEKSL